MVNEERVVRVLVVGLAMAAATYSTAVSRAVMATAAEATGAIQGRVSLAGGVQFAGEAPAAEPIDMAADEYCVSAHQGAQVLDPPINTDADGALRDVVVFVQTGLTRAEYPVPEAPTILDQQGCLYAPKAIALQAGQTLVIRNSDETLHNVNVNPRVNRGFNVGQPIKGIETKRSFTEAEVGIEVGCDIHGWMDATISVFDHPYFDVSATDGGFAIEGLDPGEYVVAAWHPALGRVEAPVRVFAGATAEVEFVFEAAAP